MASKLGETKTALVAAADNANKIAQEISQLGPKFGQSVQAVQNAIEGSSRGEDKKIIGILQDAEKKAKAAVNALEQAAKASKQVASNL